MATIIKQKALVLGISSGTITSWMKIKLRPLVSYKMMWYRPWYRLAGQVTDAMVREVYEHGAQVWTNQNVLYRLYLFNQNGLTHDFTTHVLQADVDQFYNKVQREDIIETIEDGINTMQNKRRLWA